MGWVTLRFTLPHLLAGLLVILCNAVQYGQAFSQNRCSLSETREHFRLILSWISDATKWLFPLVEALASRARFVIVSGSDGQTGGNAYGVRLITEKMERDMKCVSLGSYQEHVGGLSSRPMPSPHLPLTRRTEGRKSSFQISPPNRLEVDKDVNRAHFIIEWLVVKWWNEHFWTIVQLSPEWVKADRAQYAWSSSGPAPSPLWFDLVWNISETIELAISKLMSYPTIFFAFRPEMTLPSTFDREKIA